MSFEVVNGTCLFKPRQDERRVSSSCVPFRDTVANHSITHFEPPSLRLFPPLPDLLELPLSLFGL